MEKQTQELSNNQQNTEQNLQNENNNQQESNLENKNIDTQQQIYSKDEEEEKKDENIDTEKQKKREELLKKAEERKKDMLKKISIKFKDKNIKLDVKTMVAFRLTKNDNLPIQIYKNIYLGSIGAALCKEQLINHKIDYVLNVSGDDTPKYPTGIENYKQIKLNDSIQQVIIPHFEETNKFIQEAVNNNKNILVHCFAGKSRSVTVIIAYLMFNQNMTRDEALDLIRDKRPTASPNYGFMKQLLVYESILKKKQIKQKDEEQQLQKSQQELQQDQQLLSNQEQINQDQQNDIQQK